MLVQFETSMNFFHIYNTNNNKIECYTKRHHECFEKKKPKQFYTDMAPGKQNERHGPKTQRVLCRDMHTCVEPKSSLIVLKTYSTRGKPYLLWET